MKRILFKKMHGSGNDFILIDNRDREIEAGLFPRLARLLCKRHFGIGADGLIIIEDSDIADFKWHFFNADGSSAEMCGNGGRCAARFATLLGIGKDNRVYFETLAGIIEAEVKGQKVKLQLTPPSDLRLDIDLFVENEHLTVHFVNTGVPHVVVLCRDVDKIDVKRLGASIRWHNAFKPNGTNVNFVQIEGNSLLKVRTYERGVEDETYACGTGSVASALIAYKKALVQSPVKVVTSGGEELKVYLENKSNKEKLYLEGPTVLVYSGIAEEILDSIF